MKYYAQIQNNVVVNISCAADDWIAPSDFVEYTNSNPAMIGCIYNKEKHRFVYQQPYPSWTLDSNLVWQPPVAKPNGNFAWNEGTQSWVVPVAG